MYYTLICLFLAIGVSVGWIQSTYTVGESTGVVLVCSNLTGLLERAIIVNATSISGTATGT